MDKKQFLAVSDLIVANTNLTDGEKIILKGYFDGTPDVELAKRLKLKSKVTVRGKRQNICSKIGNTLLSHQRMIRSDIYKFL